MADFIKNIIVFALLITIMNSIINNESFRMYFKFFSGLILILLMLSPLLSFLSGSDKWYKTLEEEIFHFELGNVNDELDIADGKFEKIIKEGCKKDIEEQIKKMAQKREVNVKDIKIKFDNNSSSIQLAAVDIGIDKTINEKDNSSKDIKAVDIETVTIMSDETDKRNSSNYKSEKTPVNDKNVKKLKEDISSYFLVKEAAVNIWE